MKLQQQTSRLNCTLETPSKPSRFPRLNALAEKAKRNGKLKFSEFKAFRKIAIRKGKTHPTFK
jgi:hypothetical protein